jgi:putative FmdB family regulatory protein
MPVYEYSCNACSAKVSIFVRSINSEVNCVCDRCGSTDLRRLVSSFRVLRAPFDISKVDKRQLLDGVDYSNPASMAQFFKRMGDEFQDEPDENMDEIIGRLEHGERVEDALQLETHDHSAHSGSEGDSEP